eukprot:SAG31_NODE_225_length_19846_cov_19.057983_15_plen_190_part_00
MSAAAAEAELFEMGRALSACGTVCHEVSADGADYFFLRLGDDWQASATSLVAAAAAAYAQGPEVAADGDALIERLTAAAAKPTVAENQHQHQRKQQKRRHTDWLDRRKTEPFQFYPPPAPVGLHISIRDKSPAALEVAAQQAEQWPFVVVVRPYPNIQRFFLRLGPVLMLSCVSGSPHKLCVRNVVFCC